MGKKIIVALGGVSLVVLTSFLVLEPDGPLNGNVARQQVKNPGQPGAQSFAGKSGRTVYRDQGTAAGKASAAKARLAANAPGSPGLPGASGVTTSELLDAGDATIKNSGAHDAAGSWPQVVAAASRLFEKYGSNRNGQSLYLKPGVAENIAAGDASQVQAILVQAGKAFFRIQSSDELNVVTSRVDDLDNVYYTFQQTYQGIPVHGRKLVVRTDREDRISLIAGTYESDLDLATRPSFTGEHALMQALNQLDLPPVGIPVVHKQPELMVYVQDAAGGSQLAYRAVVEYMDAKGVNHLDEVFVSAHQPRMIKSYTQIHSAINREIYSAQGLPCLGSPFVPTSATLPGNRRFGETGSGNADSHEQGAYDHTGSAYWFYYHMYKRDSYNARGIRLRSTVHAQFMTPQFSCTGMNAQYRPEPEDQLIFGEGDGRGPGMSEASDIVGHELTHGVTHYTSDLKYENETGAINEAISDIFGSAIEAWVRSGGGAVGNPAGGIRPDANTWIVCDRCTQGVQRYMNNPTRDGQSKDYYPERYQGKDDAGGVHLNSGIMNLAFYLLSEGGTHPRGKTTTQVYGIGFEKALQIYYDANTTLFSAMTNINTGFSDARRLLADAAETRYGKCSVEWQAVNESYDAVGVPGSWQSCGVTTPAPVPGNPPVDGGSGGNLALSASATASSTYGSAYAANKLNDGSMSTRWRSKTIRNRYAQETVQLDFGTTTRLGDLVIEWSGNDYARRFYVDTYHNKRWSTVQSVRKSGKGATRLKLDTQGSKLRIRMKEGAYYRWYAINEVTVSDTSTVAKPVPAPVPYPLPQPGPITSPIPYPVPVQTPFPLPVQYPLPLPVPVQYPVPITLPTPIRLPSPVQWPVITPAPLPIVLPNPYPWWNR